MKPQPKIKSPNVVNVLQAINAIEVSMHDMNKSEMKEVAFFINQLATAFEADAPEDLKVPHIDEVTMHVADIAGMIRDSWGL